MTLPIATFFLEIYRGRIFARFGGREVYLSQQDGQPRMFFSSLHEGVTREFWGFGWYGVTNPTGRKAKGE